MIAFKRLFGRDEKFYELLEASAEEAKTSASLLVNILKQIETVNFDQAVMDLAQCRRKHKRISQEITEQLCKTFVTPLEREDIQHLSSALHKISKTVEKIGERMLITPAGINPTVLSKQTAMLQRATDEVLLMVNELRSRPHVEKIQDPYQRLQSIEGEADKLMMVALRELYQGQAEAKEVIVLKDIYELLERAIDRCRDAGNVVFQVVLKYS